MDKIYIWGDGNTYNHLASYLPLYKNKFQIQGIISNERKYSVLDGYTVYQPSEVLEEIKEIDYVVIASLAFVEIKNQLLSYGVSKNIIIRWNVFTIPWFDWDRYLLVKNQTFSIIANYCLGGRIYRELGLEILSPSVNAYCSGMQYIRFLKNLGHYMNMEMECHSNELHHDGTVGQETFCPKGIIDQDIVWNFNHHVTAQEAVDQWNHRRKRVNLDRLVILMILQTDEEAYEFTQLPYKLKLGFYHKDLKLDHVIYCKEWQDAKIRSLNQYSFPIYVNNYMLNDNYQLGKIDWIRFLSDQKDFIRFW